MSEKQKEPILGEAQQGPALVPFSAYVGKEDKSAEIEARANIDEPTGLLNKAAIEEIVKQRLTEIKHYEGDNPPRIVLMVLDTTGFKELNDTLGHLAGDLYMAALAAAIPGWFRPEDVIAVVGRSGGDELTIMLEMKPREIYEPEHQQQAEEAKEYTDDDRLKSIIARFEECKEAFFAKQPENIQELHAKKILDLAYGAALQEEGQDAHDLVEAVDKRMYVMKEPQHVARDQLEKENWSDFQLEASEKAKNILREAGLDDEAAKLI